MHYQEQPPSVSGTQIDSSAAHTNPHTDPHTNPPTASGVTYNNEARLVITRLEVSVQKYMQHSVAESTCKAYSAAQQWYFKFCEDFNYTPFPLQQDLLCYFVALLADHHMCRQTNVICQAFATCM